MENIKNKVPKENIFITGATGFIGHHLLKKLSNKYNIFTLVRDKNKSAILSQYNIILGDLSQKELLNNALKKINIVIHLAALTKYESKNELIKVNTEGTKNLIMAAKKNNIKKFIYISTLNTTLPVKNEYSRSKLLAENIVKNSGINYIIIRPSLVYGPGDKGLISQYIKLINSLPIIIPILGDGENKIQPIYVDDLTYVIQQSLDNKYNKNIINTVGPDIVSLNQLISLLCKIIKGKRFIIHIPIILFKAVIKISKIIGKEKFTFEDKLKVYQCDKISENNRNFDFMHIENGLKQIIRN